MKSENKKPNNPYAFACVTERYIQEGITLRDYFAAKAMQAYLSNHEIFMSAGELSKKKNVSIDEYVSETAYQTADAMLKQRENEN